MCLACELDALWYAEWERLATEGANVPGNAGVSPAVPGEPVSAPGAAGVSPAVFETPREVAASAALMARTREEAESAGGTPAVPGSVSEAPAVPARPARSGSPRSGFRCEEAE